MDLRHPASIPTTDTLCCWSGIAFSFSIRVLSPVGRGGILSVTPPGFRLPSTGLGSRAQEPRVNECAGQGMKEGRSG